MAINYQDSITRNYFVEIAFLALSILFCLVKVFTADDGVQNLFFGVLLILAIWLISKCSSRKLSLSITDLQIDFSEHLLKGFSGSMQFRDIESVEFRDYTAVDRISVRMNQAVRFCLKDGQWYELTDLVKAEMKIALRAFCELHSIPIIGEG